MGLSWLLQEVTMASGKPGWRYADQREGCCSLSEGTQGWWQREGCVSNGGEFEEDLRVRWTGPEAELAWPAVGWVDDTEVVLSHLPQGLAGSRGESDQQTHA